MGNYRVHLTPSCRQMLVLWKVKAEGDGNGKELYGENYADIYAINRLHYKAASPLKCDHVSSVLCLLVPNCAGPSDRTAGNVALLRRKIVISRMYK